MTISNYLHQLETSQQAIIDHLGNAALRRRFAEMVILRGVSIRAERVAPRRSRAD